MKNTDNCKAWLETNPSLNDINQKIHLVSKRLASAPANLPTDVKADFKSTHDLLVAAKESLTQIDVGAEHPQQNTPKVTQPSAVTPKESPGVKLEDCLLDAEPDEIPVLNEHMRQKTFDTLRKTLTPKKLKNKRNGTELKARPLSEAKIVQVNAGAHHDHRTSQEKTTAQ